jgi:hypothetical protein
MAARLSALRTGRTVPFSAFGTTGWVNPQGTVRLEGLGLEPGTFQLVA